MVLARKDLTCVAALLLVQALSWLAIRPAGDFPLNDDWAYMHGVEWLLSEGRVRLSDWIAPNALPQTLLGAAVSQMAGLSFEILRHVTQVVALLAGLVVFIWFRAGRINPVDALVATLVVIAMPCWPILSNTFMTDLYGLWLFMSAAVIFLRVLQSGRGGWLLCVATALACAAVLQRQVSLVLPIAFAVAWLVGQPRWQPANLIRAIGPLLATMLAALAYSYYLESGPGVPAAQQAGTERLFPLLRKLLAGQEDMPLFVGFNLLAMLGYLGLFLAPWFVWWGGIIGSGRRIAIFAVAVVLAATVTVALDWLPPYLHHNVLDAAGIGPFTLYDAQPRGEAGIAREPGIVWTVAGVAAAFGAAALLVVFQTTLRALFGRDGPVEPVMVFLVTVIAVYSGPFLLTGFFDRYLIYPMPFIILLACRVLPRSQLFASRAVAALWLALALGLGVLATHDHFSWQRARWQAIKLAERLGATPELLDGGFEYNGYFRFVSSGGKRVPGKSWWWVKDDQYVVSFTPLGNYEVIEAFDVARYLDRTPAEVLLSRRRPGSD